MKTDKENAYAIFNIDREDYWLMGTVILPCENTDTFINAFNELKEKLSSPEIVNFIIEKNCLIDDLFDCDDTFKFKEIKREQYKVMYFFENSEGDIVKKTFQEEFVKIF